MVERGDLELNPIYQRRQRWDEVRRSRLIESFLMNIPTPPIFLNEDDYGRYSLIDGQQRVSTIFDFLSDRLELRGLSIFNDANGLKFSQLESAVQRVLLSRVTIRSVVLLRLSDPTVKYYMFERLNTGGVQLNAQEIRNAVFEGPLNDLLFELAERPEFQLSLGINPSRPQASALWRSMRDAELVLRFFTLRHRWRDFSGSLGYEMNDFMVAHHRVQPTELGQLREHFTATVNTVTAGFGEFAFRKLTSTRSRTSPPLASLFDAQMIASEGVPESAMREHQEQLIGGMRELCKSDSFLKAIGAGSNTRSHVRHRVERVTDLVRTVVDRT